MTSALVLDTTCVTHFARARRLTDLEAITAGYDRLVTTEVIREAHDGLANYPAIGNLMGETWFEIVELDTLEAVRAAKYKSELGGRATEHLGECETLAVAQSRSGLALIDDADGRRTGVRHGVAVAATLSFVVKAVSTGLLDMPAASELVGDLVETDMYLPTDGPGFEAWARAMRLL